MASIIIAVAGFCALFVALALKIQPHPPSEISEATAESWGSFLLEVYAPRRESPRADCVLRLQSIADSLTSMNDIRPVTVSVALDSTINAVSLPGRRIVMHVGLLNDVQSENEITMILAHEIGHHEASHILEAFGRRAALTFASMGAGQLPIIGPILIQLGELGDLSFSRDAEFEADALGLAMLQGYYGHVGGCAEFFERRLDEGEWESATEFLNTHPLSRRRIEALLTRARNEGWGSGESLPAPPPCEGD